VGGISANAVLAATEAVQRFIGQPFQGHLKAPNKIRATHADRWQINGFGLEVHLSGVPMQCEAQRMVMAALVRRSRILQATEGQGSISDTVRFKVGSF